MGAATAGSISLQKSSRSMDSPGLLYCPLRAWLRGTPKTVVPPQRHNSAQLHPTSNGWACLPGLSRTRQAVSLSLSLCQALPILPGGQLCTSLHLTAFQGQRQAWALIFGGFFSHHHFHREKKKVCSEPLQGELNQGSFPSVKHQPSPCQPVAGPFPLPKLPVSYSALLSPKLPIPSITAHTTCVLPVISGCKREAKLQVGTGSVSITGEERGEIRPMIKGRVCPGMRFWNKVTGK